MLEFARWKYTVVAVVTALASTAPPLVASFAVRSAFSILRSTSPLCPLAKTAPPLAAGPPPTALPWRMVILRNVTEIGPATLPGMVKTRPLAVPGVAAAWTIVAQRIAE